MLGVAVDFAQALPRIRTFDPAVRDGLKERFAELERRQRELRDLRAQGAPSERIQREFAEFDELEKPYLSFVAAGRHG